MPEIAIVGAGPAGLSAALTLKLRGRDLIWFGSPDLSPKVGRSEKIANYPGVPMVTGAELNARFADQMAGLDLSLTDKLVTNIAPAGEGYMLLADNEVFEARAVLLATGVVTAPGPAGESALLGRGVSYCATCDGFLYKGKDIAVLCAQPRFFHEVEYLAGLARRVYCFAPWDHAQYALPNLTWLDRPMVQVLGESRVEGVRLQDGGALSVDGVFILRGAVAPANLLPGLALEGLHIAVDRQCRTNLPGVFAAGDCTGRPYQIAKATGEGNVAAHAILDYLAE